MTISLSHIAQEMRTYALDHPRATNHPISNYQRRLSGGLVITMYYKSGWYLSLSRKNQPPSMKEVAICKTTFDVPDYATKTPITNGPWHIIRFHWQAVKQAKLV